MTKAGLLAAALEEFLDVSPDVEAAAVVSGDGLPMASALPPYVEEDRLAAMSAALLTLGERAASGLGKGDLGQVFVEGAHGHVVLMSAGGDAVLVTVTSPRAKVGLILFEMRRTAEKVSDIMGGTGRPTPAPPEHEMGGTLAGPAAPRAAVLAEESAAPERAYPEETPSPYAHSRGETQRVEEVAHHPFLRAPAPDALQVEEVGSPSEASSASEFGAAESAPAPDDIDEQLASWPAAPPPRPYSSEPPEGADWQSNPPSDTEPEVSSWQ